MKYKWDRKYLEWGITAFCVIVCSILFFLFLNHWTSVLTVLNKIISSLSSILIGLALAYLLSPIVKFMEIKLFIPWFSKVFSKSKNKQLAAVFSRSISIFIVLLLLLCSLAALLWIVLPQLYSSGEKLVIKMPDYVNLSTQWLDKLLSGFPEAEETLLSVVSSATDYFTSWIENTVLGQLNRVIVNVSSGVISVIKAFVNFIVGVIVSCYVMFSREKIVAGAKMLFRAITSNKLYTKIIAGTTFLNKTFGGFFRGKLLDSLIIGILCAIGMAILNIPYLPLVSTIIGVTNILPFFGPYIGAVPSAFLIILESPSKGILFILFILVLQTFDGNVLGPAILGNSTGVSGFWIIFSIMLGGGLFGFWGMLFGVPVFASIYALVREFTKKRLSSKNLSNNINDYLPPPADPQADSSEEES